VSFLFPLYLLGAAALAIPVILHLRRRPPKEVISFSSHLFLQPSPERLTRRTRLERWILLALRCLALLLLAAAFSRPLFRAAAEGEGAEVETRALVLVDRSASMRREDLWAQALAAAREAVARYGPADQVALAFFDEGWELLADFPAWAALGSRDRLAAFDEAVSGESGEPTWLGSDLGEAMVRGGDRLLAADVDQPAKRRELVVVSDFIGGARLEALQSVAWPPEVRVLPVAVAVASPGNLSINLAATPLRAKVEEDEVYRVRVRNAADSDGAAARLLWKGFPETALETVVAPGTGRVLTSAPRPAGAVEGVLVVEGDAHPFDNEVYLAPTQARPLRVLCLMEGGADEGAGSPLFYLRRALQPTPQLDPIVSAAETLDAAELAEQEVVVVAGTWSEASAARLRDFAEEGRLVLAVPSAAAGADALAALAGEAGWEIDEMRGREYSLLAGLDFEHPVLQPFARAQIRDFTRIRFWKHRTLSLPDPLPEGTRVVASFDEGSPAWVERRLGAGTVFLFLSGWEPAEGQLALSSKFVPVLFSILEHAGHSIRSAPTRYVGETEHPAPGFYEVAGADGAVLVEAVNLVPSEGETTPFDPAVVFSEWEIPLIDERAEADREALDPSQTALLEASEREAAQKLWKWFLLAALIFFLFETALSGWRRGMRSAPTAGGAPSPA